MIRKYQVKLEGLTPLLMHADNVEWADEMERWKNDPANKKLSKAGDDRTPAYRWLGYVHHDGQHVCIPSEYLAACLLGAGALVPVPGGRSGKTFKAQTQSGMGVDEAFTPLLVNGRHVEWPALAALQDEAEFARHKHVTGTLGFDLVVRRVRVGTSKHIRVRPKFDRWALEFPVSVWDDQITDEVLKTLFEYAGQYKGIGDWRPSSPQKPGPYGRFRVESVRKL